MSRSSLALSNLRAVVILVVLAFHASLAYLASRPDGTGRFDEPPYTWQAFPIVDSRQWMGFDAFCAWQDVSLMSLMFLLAGLLTAPSLLRKGGWTYSSDRFRRIGLPFMLAVAFLSPLALYPAYLVRSVDPSFAGFWNQWLSLPFWPSGPQWFLWQLLAVSLLAAALYTAAPRAIDHLGRFASWTCEHPIRLFGTLVAASALGYVPLAMAYSPWTWEAVGPFSLQLSRPGHYLVYFFAGVAIGRHGLDCDFLACGGPLARNWAWWLATALVAFACWGGLTALTMPAWNNAPVAARLAASAAFPVACAAGALALLALCLRFGGRRVAFLQSLSTHAYGMYLVHYLFIVWLQYALLSSGLPAVAKAALVFSGAVVMSWASSIALTVLVLRCQGMPPVRAFWPAMQSRATEDRKW